MASCLALKVYRYLDVSIKEKLKESVRCEYVIINSSVPDNTAEKLTTLEKIMSIVARDTPMDRITRMVRLNTETHKCVLKEGGSIKQYVNRFKAPALAYLKLPEAAKTHRTLRCLTLH